MHRTEGANNLNNLYTDGPPATVITPEAMNSIQEELAFIIESAGLKLLSASNDTKTQVLEALKTIFKIGNPVQTITASSANLQVNTEYLINYTGGVCTLQLPQYFAVGDWIKIRDAGGYGFKIQQASSGNIILPNGSRTPAGSIYFVQSKSKFASLELEGVIANSRWKIVSVMDPGLRMKGYYLGGNYSASATLAFDFQWQSTYKVASTFAPGLLSSKGASSHIKGYSFGGYSGGVRTDIGALSFSTEAIATLVAALPLGRAYVGVVQTENIAFSAGGNTSGLSMVNNIEKFDFFTESCSASGSTLTTARDATVSIKSETAGYIGGGLNGSGVTISSTEKITFITEAWSVLGTTLPTARAQVGSFNAKDCGYAMGGKVGVVFVTTIDRFTFLTELAATISSTLDTAKTDPAAVEDSSKGYFLGGYTGSAGVTVIEDMDFLTESSSVISAALTNLSYQGSGVQGYAGV